MKHLTKTTLFGLLSVVVVFAACGGSEPDSVSQAESPVVDEGPAASPEAVAAAEALVAKLAASELELVPTVRGLAIIEYTRPTQRRTSSFVLRSMRIRNQSPSAIAGFQISEVWYDADGNIVTGAQVRFREPIMPQEVVDVELEIPRDPDMERSNTEFQHQGGDVRRSLVPELPDPIVEEEEEEEEGAESAA